MIIELFDAAEVAEEMFVENVLNYDTSKCNELVSEYRKQAEELATDIEDGIVPDVSQATYIIQSLAFSKKYAKQNGGD